MAISFFRVLRFQEQKLHANRRGHPILDRADHEDDPLLQHA